MVSRVVSVEFTEKGAQRVTSAMSDIEKQANKTASSTSKSTTHTGAAFTKLQGNVKGTASSLSALNPSGLLAGAGLLGVAAGLTSIVNAGREQLKATRLTQAVLTSTGNAAGVSAGQVENLASSLSKQSGVADEVIQSGENVLLTFTNVRNEVGKGNDVFTQATKASLDMSAALGGDLQSNIIRVGKALQDPIGGLTALKRVGVNVDELKGKVTALVASGDKLGAQKAILQELGTEFGGAAAAAADPFAKLNTSINELKESLGKEVIPLTGQFVSLLSKAVSIVPTGPIGESKTGKGGLFSGGAGHFLQGAVTAAVFPLALFGQGKDATDELTKATNKLDDAKKKLLKDSGANASGSVLAADADKVNAAQGRVTAITDRATAALAGNASAAADTSFAYLGLADSVKTAGGAYKALVGSVTTDAASPFQLALDTDAAKSSDLALHGKLDTPTGSGAGKSAVETSLDQSQKELALRDARRDVATTATAVTSAELQLKQARESGIESARALALAEKQYDIVLGGVADNSRAARQAHQDLVTAQDREKSSALGLIDAQRALKDAQDAAKLAPRLAQEGATGASLGVRSANLNLKDAQTALQRARESEDPKTIEQAQIALGEAQLQVAQATDAQVAAQKELTESGKKNSKATEDVKRAQIGLTEAQIAAKQAAQGLIDQQKLTNETLDGYAKNSKQAKQATTDLTNARIADQQATLGVTTAQQGLISAQDQVATSTLAVQHAQADLDGQLNKSTGFAAAEKSAGGFISKLDDLRTKTIAVANDAGAAVTAAGIKSGESVQQATAEGLLANITALQSAVAAEPLLSGAFDSVIGSYQSYVERIDKKIASRSNAAAFQHPTSSDTASTHRAAGGPVRAGQSYLVGENGPELFKPRGDGQIVPNHALQNSRPYAVGSSSGGNLTIQVYGNIYGEIDMQRIVDNAVEKQARNNPHVTPGRRR